jgi:hypothetical protein
VDEIFLRISISWVAGPFRVQAQQASPSMSETTGAVCLEGEAC